MKKNSGFTLVEILVAVSIFLILIFSVFAAMGVGTRAGFSGDTSVEVRQEIIKAFMTMEKELKVTRPSQIDLRSGTTNTTLTFKLPQDNNGDGTILDAGGNVEWSGNITYALNNANQITRTAAGVTRILSHDIMSLLFTRTATSVDLLQIDITAQKVSAARRTIQDSGQITIRMRN
ncbi:MAG: prepilin-type N-terminal cleavage/methylation domain-containing protein [Candidatus Omnitrophica bacterium]|nr:prepilin-type N-terminal cleavage/methylation domain-containing protein [Candidatus Omnitrophota bacterium]